MLVQAEGIFRINADNSQEEYVRDQLNHGVVPDGIDVHCLAGLIKVPGLPPYACPFHFILFLLLFYWQLRSLYICRKHFSSSKFGFPSVNYIFIFREILNILQQERFV